MAADFLARLYRVGFPPDADGDVIFAGAIEDGVTAQVSLEQHDTMRDPSIESAGEAVLRHQGESVVGEGVIFDTPRGRELRKRLREREGAQQWSVGYRVLEWRRPTSEELALYPDTKRVIVRWAVDEISPVQLGACGPTCRTLAAKGVKCACGCGCDVRDAALKELVRFEAVRARTIAYRLADMARFVEAEDKQLDPSEIRDDVRRAAAWGVKAGAVLVGGGRPGAPLQIVWFSADVRGMRGFAVVGKGPIYLRETADPEEALYAAAHEGAHAAGVNGEDECGSIAQLALTGWRTRNVEHAAPAPRAGYWELLRRMQDGR